MTRVPEWNDDGEFERRIEENVQRLADSALPGERSAAEVADLATRGSSRDSWFPRVGGALAAGAIVGVVVGAALLRSGSAVNPGEVGSPVPSLAALEQVSLSNPTGEERDVMLQCRVLEYPDQVVGMAKVPNASDLPLYVRLTGNEPEIQTDKPAWVVSFGGEVRIPTVSQAGIITATTPTCVIVDGVRSWFLTGPSVDSLGERREPITETDPPLKLPGLAP